MVFARLISSKSIRSQRISLLSLLSTVCFANKTTRMCACARVWSIEKFDEIIPYSDDVDGCCFNRFDCAIFGIFFGDKSLESIVDFSNTLTSSRKENGSLKSIRI